MKRKTSVEKVAGDEETGPRIIVRIELTPGAKSTYGQVAKRFGMTQISTTSRLMEWFAKQTPGVQAAILSQYPKEIEGEVAKMMLDKM